MAKTIVKAILVGTRKGAWILRTKDRKRFDLQGPHFFGHLAPRLAERDEVTICAISGG